MFVWMFPESPPLFLTHLHQVCPFPQVVFFVLLLSHFFSVSLLYVSFSPSVSFSHFYSSQINSMKFLQQLNRQSALMRHRGHGDRGRKETGGEVSMAMRCVSEACYCNAHFPVCEMCVFCGTGKKRCSLFALIVEMWNMYFNNVKAHFDADRLGNANSEQGMTLKLPFISPPSHQKGQKGQIFAFHLFREE